MSIVCVARAHRKIFNDSHGQFARATQNAEGKCDAQLFRFGSASPLSCGRMRLGRGACENAKRTERTIDDGEDQAKENGRASQGRIQERVERGIGERQAVTPRIGR